MTVREIMAAGLADGIANRSDPPPHAPQVPDQLIAALVAPLVAADPQASAAAEAAFVLGAFCLAEERVLSVLPPSEDLENDRVRGDRATSESLSQMLAQYNVPATEGALQSVTYRGGYASKTAKNPALVEFGRWLDQDGRSLEDVGALFRRLAWHFGQLEVAFPPLPALDASRLTFARTRQLVEMLREQKSQGAYEQYLVAAFLEQEYGLLHPAWRVETKRSGAADAASESFGDVQVRRRMALVYALEVSGEEWEAKLDQAVKLARRGAQVTIVAGARKISGTSIQSALHDRKAGDLDIAVVDIDSYLDSVNARMTPQARAAAIRRLHAYLVRWGRTRPDLVQHVVEAVKKLELATLDRDEGGAVPTRLGESLDRMRALIEASDGSVEVSKDDLDLVLSWTMENLGVEPD